MLLLSTNFRPTFSSKSSNLILQPNIPPQKVGEKKAFSLLSLGHPVIITLWWCIFHHATRPISSLFFCHHVDVVLKVIRFGFMVKCNHLITCGSLRIEIGQGVEKALALLFLLCESLKQFLSQKLILFLSENHQLSRPLRYPV